MFTHLIFEVQSFKKKGRKFATEILNFEALKKTGVSQVAI
jgi:hypothetical protein